VDSATTPLAGERAAELKHVICSSKLLRSCVVGSGLWRASWYRLPHAPMLISQEPR